MPRHQWMGGWVVQSNERNVARCGNVITAYFTHCHTPTMCVCHSITPTEPMCSARMCTRAGHQVAR